MSWLKAAELCTSQGQGEEREELTVPQANSGLNMLSHSICGNRDASALGEGNSQLDLTFCLGSLSCLLCAFGFSHKSVPCSLGLCAGGACDRHEAAISRNPAATLRHSAIAFRVCTHHVLYTFKKKKEKSPIALYWSCWICVKYYRIPVVIVPIVMYVFSFIF